MSFNEIIKTGKIPSEVERNIINSSRVAWNMNIVEANKDLDKSDPRFLSIKRINDGNERLKGANPDLFSVARIIANSGILKDVRSETSAKLFFLESPRIENIKKLQGILPFEKLMSIPGDKSGIEKSQRDLLEKSGISTAEIEGIMTGKRSVRTKKVKEAFEKTIKKGKKLVRKTIESKSEKIMIYIGIVETKMSLEPSKLKTILESKNFVFDKIKQQWLKKAENVQEAKEIIKEVFDLGYRSKAFGEKEGKKVLLKDVDFESGKILFQENRKLIKEIESKNLAFPQATTFKKEFIEKLQAGAPAKKTSGGKKPAVPNAYWALVREKQKAGASEEQAKKSAEEEMKKKKGDEFNIYKFVKD